MSVLQPTNEASIQTHHKGIVIHALHKSASMFLYKFFKHLCRQRGFDFFSENNAPANPLTDVAMIRSPFCHCPVRTFDVDPMLSGNASVRRIYQVRDPRDMLVSEYYSFGWTHPTEASNLDERRTEIQKMSIDEYVLRQPEFSSWPLEQKFAPLMARNLDSISECVVKYETMVLNFPKWAAAVIRPFEFRIPAFAVAKLAWRYRSEFKPSGEGEHKRKITPGDFREQLSAGTIRQLNQRFADVLERFGYEA